MTLRTNAERMLIDGWVILSGEDPENFTLTAVSSVSESEDPSAIRGATSPAAHDDTSAGYSSRAGSSGVEVIFLIDHSCPDCLATSVITLPSPVSASNTHVTTGDVVPTLDSGADVAYICPCLIIRASSPYTALRRSIMAVLALIALVLFICSILTLLIRHRVICPTKRVCHTADPNHKLIKRRCP